MAIAAEYPQLGPLLASAFDKAVDAPIRSWIWIVVLVLVCVGAEAFDFKRALQVSAAVWSYTAAANAVRTINPEYKMTAGTVGKLLLANFAMILAGLFGLLALVWTGVYLTTKLSMALAAVAFDNVPAEVGLRVSWDLTTGRFWQTFLFLVVVLIAVYATVLVAGFLVGALAGALVITHVVPLTMERAAGYATALLVPIVMFAVQAHWLAGLHWYQSLKAMEEAEMALRFPTEASA